MSDTDLFQNSHWVVPVVAIACLLWLVFVWKEWKKPIKNGFYFSLVMALVTVFCFAMLALKPVIRQSAQTHIGILTTPGFDQDRLDSLENSIIGSLTFEYKMNEPMRKVLDSSSNLIIVGEGIQPFDFWQLEHRPVTYLGSKLADGIIELKYPRENSIGAKFDISGYYQNAASNHRLVLEDAMGVGLDSFTMGRQPMQQFRLSTSLRAQGKYVFKLVEKDSLGEAISSEPIPLTVKESKKLKVALINGFPTFETKYLKNYLGEMGHEVVVRSQLTRGRYKFEYFNTERNPIYSLGEKELGRFDLMVIDGSSFRNLSSKALTSLENSVKENGLGLFVHGEPGWFDKTSNRLNLEFERDGVSKSAWNRFPNILLEKLPYRFIDTLLLQSLQSDDRGPITAYRRMQKGRIGTSMVQNTYQLQLEGKVTMYRAFWSEIVNGLSKKEETSAEWEMQTRFPLEDQPMQFSLRTTIETPQVLTADGDLIPLQQDLDIPTLWTGTTYPGHKGWNVLRLRSKPDAVLNYFVVDQQNWKAYRTNLLQKLNKHNFSLEPVEPKPAAIYLPIEPLWFFILGVMGLGYLWVRPKL